MRILALEPYFGGSHRAFLDGWRAHSRHEFKVLGLPARTWKWRMRHAAVTFAEQARELCQAGQRWDAVFCSDMLNLAEFRGLCPAAVAALPTVAYFHENQLTYPVRKGDERDFHFGYTNFTTCLAADEIWFNSDFHRNDFLNALSAALQRMPDYQEPEQVARIDAKSKIQPPGIEAFSARTPRQPGPLRILWAARWEHDKNPTDFFLALDALRASGIDFRVSVIGEQFREVPAVFAEYEKILAGCIDRWGFQSSREEYRAALLEADIFVSTANHEFFGIAAAEAIAAGCLPLLPNRLAYPELLAALENCQAYLYDGSVCDLVEHLTRCNHLMQRGFATAEAIEPLRRSMDHLHWKRRATEMDAAMESVRT